MFRQLRILIGLLVLLFVAISAALTSYRATNWDNSLRVYVYPINGDGSSQTADYINKLTDDNFQGIENFFQREVSRYREMEEPLLLTVAPEVQDMPPPPPRSSNILKVMYWSLKMRYWSWSNSTHTGRDPDIQMFVVYFDPVKYTNVGHSFGLEKGLVGVVHAFSGKRGEESNNVVIAHELLHTLGASDKYDLSNNLPLYPLGYAEPNRKPLYPQVRAEIMGGRIPLSPELAKIPNHLKQTMIGPITALEIKLIEELPGDPD
jgi:hypothetical protein